MHVLLCILKPIKGLRYINLLSVDIGNNLLCLIRSVANYWKTSGFSSLHDTPYVQPVGDAVHLPWLVGWFACLFVFVA